jgi:putative two-component system response regulator
MAPSVSPSGYVLVVDDDPEIARFIARLLSADGHQVSVAHTGTDALAKAAAHPPDLVLLDLGLPGLSGLDVCRQLKADPSTRLTPVLVLTGEDPADRRVGAWDAGADEYLTKPARAADVAARCRSLLRLKAAQDELDSAQATLAAFARAVEAKCPFTLGHTERVTDLAVRLAVRVGLSAADREVVRRGALLHDIGKISTPDAVLNKPGRLTAAEFAVVKRHPLEGVRIVEPLRSLRVAIPLIRWHHERANGSGYPDGLSGEAIPRAARLLAVADVYDALASDRPYRPAMAHPECLRVMRQDAAGGGLDRDLVEALVAELQESPG